MLWAWFKSFELAQGALDVFLKRIQRGGLIVAGIFDDDAMAASDELGQEIAILEQGLSDLYDTFNQPNGVGFLDDADKILKDIFIRIDRVRNIQKVTAKDTEKGIVKTVEI